MTPTRPVQAPRAHVTDEDSERSNTMFSSRPLSLCHTLAHHIRVHLHLIARNDASVDPSHQSRNEFTVISSENQPEANNKLGDEINPFEFVVATREC